MDEPIRVPEGARKLEEYYLAIAAERAAQQASAGTTEGEVPAEGTTESLDAAADAAIAAVSQQENEEAVPTLPSKVEEPDATEPTKVTR